MGDTSNRRRARFSHVSHVGDYMTLAARVVDSHFPTLEGKSLLDIPAGNGWIGDRFRDKGARVISADINEARSDFMQVDMEQPLPFDDKQFDAIVCAEGIEHVFSPYNLFSELCRVLKQGGILVLTTPNIQNLFSRYQILCTGYPYMFDPFSNAPLEKDAVGDKGHISPVSYIQLRYWSEHFGLTVQAPRGDKIKRPILIPFLIPFILIGKWWVERNWKQESGEPHRREIIDHLFSRAVLLSRSLVFIATK